jgi:hypothetical protein
MKRSSCGARWKRKSAEPSVVRLCMQNTLIVGSAAEAPWPYLGFERANPRSMCSRRLLALRRVGYSPPWCFAFASRAWPCSPSRRESHATNLRSSGMIRFRSTRSAVRPDWPSIRGGHATYVVVPAPAVSPPNAPGLCTSSVRAITAAAHVFSAWWNVRHDSSSALVISSSADSGKTWSKPIAVDTTDISSAGCNRPPPSVATVGDDLFVAYSMVAPEGKGVFFAHSMGAMVHSPVAVIYGDRLVPTAIATDGDDVAVAYEDPNGPRQQVGVAFSAAQGHIFSWHTVVSRGVDIATSPAVAIAGRRLAVSWATRRPTDTTASRIPRVVRVGRIQ